MTHRCPVHLYTECFRTPINYLQGFFFLFIYKINVQPVFYNIGMFDVVVSILNLAEDGFHKLSEGYGIYVVLQYLMKGRRVIEGTESIQF